MNHEIISAIAPKEYLKAFYAKNIRPDKRSLLESRQKHYTYNVLDFEKFSCSTTLGDGNRVICVLKINEIQNSTDLPITINDNCNIFNFKIFINNGVNTISSNSVNIHNHNTEDVLLLDYVDILLRNNIKLNNTNKNIKEVELHIRILNLDGNIYDCISYMLYNFLKEKDICNVI